MELEEKIAPDLIHLNGYVHGSLLFRAPVLIVGHSCVFSWWQAVKKGDCPAYSEYRRRVREGIACADLVVAPTQAMLNCLEKYYGPISNTQVIFNGRDSADPVPRLGHEIRSVPKGGRRWRLRTSIA